MRISAADRGVLRYIQAAVAISLALACASPSAAESLYYDPFLLPNSDGDSITDPAEPELGEYNLGAISGQNPAVGPSPFLAGPWTADVDSPNATVQELGLSYLGAPALGGSQLSTPNARARRSLSSPWTAMTGGTFYMSFAVNFGQGDYADGITGNDMGYRAVEFWSDGGGFAMGITYNTFGSTIGPQQQDPRMGRMYADFTGITGAHQILEGSPDSFMADGLTHLIVLRFNLSDQALSDSIFVYLDPTSVVEPEVPAAFINGIDFTLGAMGGFTIFGGSGTFPVFDEMRVATSYAEALPDLPLPGDANGDGDVDIDDFNIITSQLNLGGPGLAGDVAGSTGKQGTDGRVDLRDLQLWRTFRTDLSPGAGSGSLADGSVPEPATLTLLAVGMASLVTTCRGRRRN